jgi:2,4-dienoyl-CoA reductase-like NADH-dependent reductase (Old Yellow Enzyme family)
MRFIENNMVDFVGIGRMVLSYPDICADSLAGKNRPEACRVKEIKRNCLK